MKAAILLITTLIILAFFNIAIYKKENILQDGQPVLLKLAPVDPRSMMQGDYMQFRYDITVEMEKMDATELQSHHYAVIQTDEKNIAHFVRLHAGEALKENEKLIKYRYRDTGFRKIVIKPDTFMFQEGLQPLYEKAAFAIFRYKGTEDYLLTGVVNSSLEEINPPVNE